MMKTDGATSIDIDSSFPGGNIVVERKEGDRVWVHQDLRDTTTDWFHWCFRVRGATGRVLRFHFTQTLAIGVRGPAVSLDGGLTWRWLGTGDHQPNAFEFEFPQDAEDVRFSFGMPYQAADWDVFVANHPKRGDLIQDRLCVDRTGRSVEYARLGCTETEPIHRVAILCRHHCCEMMASYALEGLVDSVLSNQSDQAKWLKSNVEFFVVPFVDKDGVEDGDQGKNRNPHDHNRDYNEDGIYPSTQAIRRLLPEWSKGRLDITLDLHCPWIQGKRHEVIYLPGSSEERIAKQQIEFSRLLETSCQGPLPFAADDFLPYGTGWNTAKNRTGGKSFTRWVGGALEVGLPTSIEIPYANAHGVEVNQETARGFGVDLARGMAAWLMSR